MSPTDDLNAVERKEIEALEEREAQAMRDGDIPALQKLWADDLVVNSTANLIAGKQILLETIRKGLLKLRTYERRPVRIVPFGDLVITTGSEVSQLVGGNIIYKMFVSYMNVWSKRDGNWQLVARHVGLIQREKPEPLP
jgi:ketosteroid isomerase-like protein